MTGAAVLLGVLLLSAAGTAVLRALALRRGLLDRPNHRSAHSVPTPRLGGVAISAAAIAGWVALRIWNGAPEPWHMALAYGGVMMALVGLLDDIRSLSPPAKFAGEVLAIALPLTALAAPGGPLTVAQALLAGSLMVSYINFFNFMDGSDGLAAGVALLSAAGLAALALGSGAAAPAWMALAVAAAAAGFLLHNYPPASIFMGDSGSLFLGYALSALAVTVMLSGVAWQSTILVLSPFLFDAIFTLCLRARNRETLWRAHMSHLYQRLIRSGSTARTVAWLYFAWTLLAIGLALVLQRAPPAAGPWMFAAGLLPGCLLIVHVRRRERRMHAGTRHVSSTSGTIR